MKHFTIDAENNITVHATRKAARETDAGVFATEEQFSDLIGPDNTVDHVAQAAGTSGYEVLTALGPRYRRRYIGEIPA